MKNATAETKSRTMVSLTMTIRQEGSRKYNAKGITLAKMDTYGVLLPDGRTILAEGRTFHAGRKAGFGKTAYLYESLGGKAVKVTISNIEAYSA